MTELMELYRERGMEAVKEQLKAMETGLLFAELDDTIQFDICKINNDEWLRKDSDKKLYRLILGELQDRLSNSCQKLILKPKQQPAVYEMTEEVFRLREDL